MGPRGTKDGKLALCSMNTPTSGLIGDGTVGGADGLLRLEVELVAGPTSSWLGGVGALGLGDFELPGLELMGLV